MADHITSTPLGHRPEQNSSTGHAGVLSSASSVKDKYIEDHFDIEYHNIPSENGNKIKAKTWKDVFVKLLPNLSVDTIEEVEDILENTVPSTVNDACEHLLRQLREVYAECKFDDFDPSSRAESYKNLWNALSYQCFRMGSGTVPEVAFKVLRVLLQVVDMIVYPKVWLQDKKVLHKGWTEFLRAFFDIVCVDFTRKGEAKNSVKSAKYTLCDELSSSRIYLGKMRKDTIISKPDMLIMSKEWNLANKDCKKVLAREVAMFVVDVKPCCPDTDVFGPGEKVDFEHVEDSLLVKDMSSARLLDPSTTNCNELQRSSVSEKPTDGEMFAGIRCQHLLQLLAAMKKPFNNIGWPGHTRRMFDVQTEHVKKCYGLYMAMDRVFLTLLKVVRREDDSDDLTDIEADTFVEFVGVDPDLNGPNSHLVLKMSCSDYLSIFDPVHTEAFLNYLKIVLWYEEKHMLV